MNFTGLLYETDGSILTQKEAITFTLKMVYYRHLFLITEQKKWEKD